MPIIRVRAGVYTATGTGSSSGLNFHISRCINEHGDTDAASVTLEASVMAVVLQPTRLETDDGSAWA